MPVEPATPDDLKGAARVGAELRGVRERLGWDLADVAAGLRIRLPYLQAIEAGQLAALPGAAYQTGFVRSYAQALGLDAEEILRRFRAEGLGVVTKAELSFLAPVPDRAVPTGAIVLLGVILLLAGYGLWYRHTEHDRRLAAEIPSVPAELAPLAVPKPAPPPPAPAPAAKPPSPTAMAPAAAIPATASPTASTTASGTASATTSPPTAPPTAPAPPTTPAAAAAGSVMPAQAGTPTVSPPAAAPPAAGPPSEGKTITATADSWVQVQDATGTILFSRVLHAGDSWPVPDLPGLTMTAGNAGATQITDTGKPGAPLGSPGTVIRNYALTPAASPAATPSAPATAAPRPAAPAPTP